MIITKEIEFDAGHRVPNHKSKCRNLHGHRYKVEAGVRGLVSIVKGSSDEGMVIDFGDLKKVMTQEIHDVYDHGFIMYEGDEFRRMFTHLKTHYQQNIHLVPFIPTAENLARHFYDKIRDKLKTCSMDLDYIKIWETPTSTACYRR